MKKMVIILAIMVVIFNLVPTNVEAELVVKYQDEAEELNLIGVFKGTDKGFELERFPKRIEGIVMLIRLLGKEEEARLLENDKCNFSDVPLWGIGYVNYAYKNGLTKGIGNNLFGSNNNINAKSYMTLLLRTIGYKDSNGDFQYEKSLEFAKDIGILNESDVFELKSEDFLRDHIAKLSLIILFAKINSMEIKLIDKLVLDGVISNEEAEKLKELENGKLEIHFIDVGQADSILIKKKDEAMLIDGGNDDDAKTIINYLKDEDIDTLKYVVATHPHEDHIGGLDDVINEFDVENIIMSNAESKTHTFENLLNAISKKRLVITYAVSGDVYKLLDSPFMILAPNNETYEDINNYSVVIKLMNNENSFIFTGDAEIESEKEMMRNNYNELDSDLIKIGHHGSNSSTMVDFLTAVSPESSVISVGKDNIYGHPKTDVLNRLRGQNIDIYRTDINGTIIAISNGEKIRFNVIPDKVILGDNQSSESNDILNEFEDYNGLIISNLDKIKEVVTIKNNTLSDINLKGFRLVSVTGNQKYILPEYILNPGEIVTIASGDSLGNLIWTSDNVWNNSKSDPAILYDSEGSEIFKFND